MELQVKAPLSHVRHYTATPPFNPTAQKLVTHTHKVDKMTLYKMTEVELPKDKMSLD